MSSHGEVSRDKVSAASVEGIHLLVKNTKTWSNSELKKLCKITAYDSYGAEETDGGGTNPGGGSGNTSQGGSGTQGGGSENTGQGGGSDSGTTGGGSDGDSTDVTI